MTIESEVAALTTATTNLLSAVNVSKSTLDAKVAAATTQAALATTNGSAQVALATAKASESLASSATSATSATTATSQASAAAASAAAALAAQTAAVAVVTGGTGSLVAAAGKLPMANGAGRLDPSWYAAMLPNTATNDIGLPGGAGFGVGICPTPPSGYTPMPGCTDVLSANYGNYQYSDGSIMVWVPAYYFRLGNAANPTYGTYGANSVSVKPISAYPDEATANSASFYRHRAFVNAGANQLGFFRDKYDCSNNAGTCSSIALAAPVVSGPAAGQIGFNVCTNNGQTPANNYSGSLQAAKSRGAKFFPESVFIADALARLSEAHAQASTAATYCAWYDATGVKNYPKGNDNNALKSESDLTLSFTTAGASSYPNFALTGSGSTLAKTTHNGQACGITDVAGNIFKINPGMTCVASDKTITAATQASPVALTIAAHGYTTGQVKQVLSVGGMTQINDRFYTVTVVDANTITLDGVDGSAFGAYTSGGVVRTGAFYTLKPSVDIATVTAGASLATDHWGAAGVAALFDAVTLNFTTTYPSNGNSQRFGNGANAVFDMSTSNGRALAMLGMPAAGGMSSSGTNANGADEIYQYLQDQLCVLSRAAFSHGSLAGVRYRYLYFARYTAYSLVGLACASYLP